MCQYNLMYNSFLPSKLLGNYEFLLRVSSGHFFWHLVGRADAGYGPLSLLGEIFLSNKALS